MYSHISSLFSCLAASSTESSSHASANCQHPHILSSFESRWLNRWRQKGTSGRIECGRESLISSDMKIQFGTVRRRHSFHTFDVTAPISDAIIILLGMELNSSTDKAIDSPSRIPQSPGSFKSATVQYLSTTSTFPAFSDFSMFPPSKS